MKIFPAIDLRGGKVVRLTQGDYSQTVTYGDSPLDTAREFKEQGAKNLHVVDLDAAKDGGDANTELICSIARNSGLFVQTGGGIRSMEKIEKYLSSGVGRVILGTAAIKDERLLKSALDRFGEKIAVGVDAKDSKVAIGGWLDVTNVDSFDFCKELVKIGVSSVIYTDISRDGKLSGVNLEAYRRLRGIEGLNVIASGGVSGTGDVAALAEIGCYGCIIGKALYEGRLTLGEALAKSGDSNDN